MPKPKLFAINLVTVFKDESTSSHPLGLAYAHAEHDAFTDGVDKFGLPAGHPDPYDHGKLLGFNASSVLASHFEAKELASEDEVAEALMLITHGMNPKKARYVATAMT